MLRALKVVRRKLKTPVRVLNTALLSLKTMPLTFAKWITGIATIASILFVGFQYLDGRWKSRIERSLNLVMLYQNETTLKARNEIDLRDDPMVDINNQFECKAYDKNVALAQNDTSRIRGINIDDYNQVCQVNRCRAAIHDFVNRRTGERRFGPFNKNTSEIKYNEHGVLTKKILDLSDGEAIETKWGKVRAISGGELWWFDKGTAYDYSWPDMVWKFLNTKDNEGQSECLKLLGQYEELLNRISTDIIKSLHSLKHFYATVSICTTSGVCDFFVACEAFYREVGTFVANWQGYFELWSAREMKAGYDRLHDFLEHCSSNQEFMRYNSTGSISEMLYAQQFMNYCLGTTGKDHGLCGALRWVTETGAGPNTDVTLRVHHFLLPDAPTHAKFIEPWAHRIEEESDGRIKVEIYPLMGLGGAPRELYHQVRHGENEADIVWTLIGHTPGEFPRSEVFELPTVHRGSALATTLAIQDVFDQIAPDYADVHPLLIHAHAGQVLHMVDKPIRSVDDLAGLKIRIPSNTGAMLIEEWDADPVDMPVPELPEALQDRRVDGALVPYEIVLPLKIYDFTRQSIEPPDGRRFGTSVFAFLMNKDRYDGLPDDLKAVIDANSGAAIAEEIGEIWDQVEKPGKDATIASRNGIIVLDPEAMAEFDKRSKRVTARWLENMKAEGIDGDALLGTATDAVERHSRSNGRSAGPDSKRLSLQRPREAEARGVALP